MKIQVLLTILLVANCGVFLEEQATMNMAPFAPIMIQEDIETAVAPEQEYTYDPDSVLKAAEEQQILIARNYEQNMPAKGECIILYSECNFKGSSFKYCNQPNEMLSFKLPILSVYVPIGQQFEMTDAVEGNKVNMLLSHDCLPFGLHLPEPQLQPTNDAPSWLGEIKDSDKATEDLGELATPKIQFYDIDGTTISREQYQKMVEDDARRSYEILTSQPIIHEVDSIHEQPQNIVNPIPE